jgi:transcriptional regulator with XRE-family HTH domain
MQPLSRLKQYREKRMLTQMELAEHSGIARSTIARLETTATTRATPHTARKLAEVLKVKPQTLV